MNSYRQQFDQIIEKIKDVYDFLWEFSEYCIEHKIFI